MAVPYAEVIGDPIGHSKSPLIHKFWLEKLGLEADYRATQVTPADLPGYLAERRYDVSWRGCNVTMPLKEAVVSFIERLDEAASKTQAVNTVVSDAHGVRSGFNTDASAVATLLGPLPIGVYASHVATYVQLIGAGGAARAAVIGSVAAGQHDFDVFNRSSEGATRMAEWLGLNPETHSAPLEALAPVRNSGDGPEDQRYSHVMINATPMGMLGNPDVPVELNDYYPDTIILDMAYTAGETRLVHDARALGLRVIDGLDMLIEQASLSFRLFFEGEPPREHDGELRELLTS